MVFIHCGPIPLKKAGNPKNTCSDLDSSKTKFVADLTGMFDRLESSIQRLKRSAAKVASINCFNFERVSSRMKSEASPVSAAHIAKLSMNLKMRNDQRPKMNF